MNLKKLNEELSTFLEEETDIVDILKDYEEEILEDLEESVVDQLADSLGYRIYTEGKDTCLVISVKRRPYISNEYVSEFLATAEGEDQYQFAIKTFANSLENEIQDFVIVGRMGGYWGLNKVWDNIQISTDGYTRLTEIVNELKEQDPEAETYEIILDNIDKLTEELDGETIEFKPEYLAKMQELEKLIDTQEEEMNKPEYWQM